MSPNMQIGAERGGSALQVLQQRRADAMALPAILHREAELDAVILGMKRISRLADDALDIVVGHARDEAETIVVARYG